MNPARWPGGARSAHPQIIGRPSRLACLRALIEHARQRPGLWIARLDEVGAHWRSRG
jgi:hypothetical protein